MILFSSSAAQRVLAAAERGEATATTSLDLGRTTVTFDVRDERLRLPDGSELAVEALRDVVENPESVYGVVDGALEKVSWFSPETNKVYTLRATTGWPALEISGILMHRVKDTDPEADARSKVAAIGPVRGRALETCCGLGYTALHVARTADHVTVFEIDANVLEMARLNPFSAPLFEAGGRIEVRNEDVAEGILALGDAAFDAVIHDPPTLALAGELYGTAFYRELLRVLRPGGRLFHYTGDPGSRYRKQDLPGRVAQRLAEVGFEGVKREPEALGVSARKKR